MRRLYILVLLLPLVSSCGSHTYSPSWQSFAITKGIAWHNEGNQQTAYDTNSDGRIDRLRYWRGSGIARELHDQNNDGWFDTRIVIVYGTERIRNVVKVRAPHVPKAGTNTSFDIPELYDEDSKYSEQAGSSNGG
jgi:hypothetical protein